MGRLININAIEDQFIDDPAFGSKMKTVSAGNALESEKLYVNIDYIKPGAKSTKYHAHSTQEEFFFILSGSGILRMDGEEMHVRTGDMVSKPAGRGIAHQFINDGAEILQILDIGTREKEDIATYPDEQVLYVRSQKKAFDLNGILKQWTSDPNE